MSDLSVDSLTRRFGDVTALDGVSLRIDSGEFLTLLGPSGCGKTTLLRLIAGFDRPTAGTIAIDGEDVTRVPAHKRPVNMVFQRSTLFPHLDVAGNVAFGLRLARVPRAQIGGRVREALELVRLGGYERRRAHELSGGQTQRVSLARALVNRPKVLLLDEPLSALDLRIRLEMEVELRRVHRETGATFVYVTHDQREALALSDRIAVFDAGSIEQLGAPDEIYHRPDSPFAARFVGDANVLPVEVLTMSNGHASLQLGDRELRVARERAASCGVGQGWLVVRPEAVELARVPTSPGTDAVAGDALEGTVLDAAFRGTGFSYRIAVSGLAEPVKVETRGAIAVAEVGGRVVIRWHDDACRLLPRE
jgi:ABC-type Fe3+/spermidine/putrescine transport system ATPase subunit